MKKSFVLILALIIIQISLGQNNNTEIVSELKVETTDNISVLTARTYNRTDLYYNLRYKFSVVTFDKNYKSSKVSLKDFLESENVSNQTLSDFIKANDASDYTSTESSEDFFSLDPYQSKDLIRISLETSIQNKIIVLLLIYDDDGIIVAKSRVVFNDEIIEEDEEKKEHNSSEGIKITGIVLEETLTKNGKDFFDQFYNYYSDKEINGDEVVVIDEMFTFRSRTKIIVRIGDEEIYSFFGSSNDEYIYDMVEIVGKEVYQYFENKKKEKSYITRF